MSSADNDALAESEGVGLLKKCLIRNIRVSFLHMVAALPVWVETAWAPHSFTGRGRERLGVRGQRGHAV